MMTVSTERQKGSTAMSLFVWLHKALKSKADSARAFAFEVWSELQKSRRILLQKSEQIAHWKAHGLFAGFVLLKGAGAAAKQLTGFALTKSQSGTGFRDLTWPKNSIYFRFELLKGALIGG